MQQIKKVVLAGALLAAIGVSGCAGVQTSGYSYNDSYKLNQANKGEGCYDASVLLGKNPSDAKGLAKKVLAAVDSTISSETDSELKAQRNRHIGVLVGSGGEELAVTLKSVTADKTFVTVTTKTGFVGGAGQKAWSCEVVDQLIALSAK